MFKRANKVTALLVAAASIMSVVPAMAAERIGTKEGTVKEAIAYGEGNYSYYGYRTDSDDTGIWYNKGGEAKDTADEDLAGYEFTNASKYGEKYAYATSSDNNEDEYLVDLSTGKIVSDETAEEKQDTAKSSLYSTIRKAERYNGIEANGSIDKDDFERILTGQFGDVWYQYTTTGAVYEGATVNGVALTQEKGSSSIDVSYTANMYVYSSYQKKAVKIGEYNKVYNDAKLSVKLDSVRVLAQDKDNLYTITTVDVTDSNVALADTKQYFIQKISKARGDKEDGVYVPKTVTSYQLTKDTAIYDNEDSRKAYAIINQAQDGDSFSAVKYAVRDGVLYVTATKMDGTQAKAKVFAIKLTKVKTDAKLVAAPEEDVDTYLAKKDADSDHDITDINTAVTVDTDGYTWILNKGTIYKYDGGFKDVYTCDRSMDSLDVYNAENLIAYEKDGGVYTTVQEGKKVTVDDAVVVDPTLGTPVAATVGWKKADAGWNFYDVNGTKTASKWVNDNGTWYYIKADGVMATGWYNDNGTWYFLKSSGAMATGWYNDNGTWYYLAASGAMLANTTVDGYVLGASGAWVK